MADFLGLGAVRYFPPFVPPDTPLAQGPPPPPYSMSSSVSTSASSSHRLCADLEPTVNQANEQLAKALAAEHPQTFNFVRDIRNRPATCIGISAQPLTRKVSPLVTAVEREGSLICVVQRTAELASIIAAKVTALGIPAQVEAKIAELVRKGMREAEQRVPLPLSLVVLSIFRAAYMSASIHLYNAPGRCGSRPPVDWDGS